jgi:hypothetical protein
MPFFATGQSATHRMVSPIQSVSIADTKIADVVVAGERDPITARI